MAANSFGAGAIDLSLPVEHQQHGQNSESQELTNPFQDISYDWQLNPMLLLLNSISAHLKSA